MTDKTDHRWLDDYLAGRTTLSEAYRTLGEPEPPGSLDKAILAEARRGAMSRSSSRWASRAWLLPVSLAVVAALSLAVVIQVTTLPGAGEEQPIGGSPTSRLEGGKLVPQKASEPTSTTPRESRDTGLATQGGRTDTRRAIPASPERLIGEHAGATRPAPALAGEYAPDEPAYANPEEWLAAIRELREAGQFEEAERELAKFKLAYPTYQVQ